MKNSVFISLSQSVFPLWYLFIDAFGKLTDWTKVWRFRVVSLASVDHHLAGASQAVGGRVTFRSHTGSSTALTCVRSECQQERRHNE